MNIIGVINNVASSCLIGARSESVGLREGLDDVIEKLKSVDRFDEEAYKKTCRQNTDAVINYVNRNKTTLHYRLSQSLKKSKFVFVGESHLAGLATTFDLISAIPKLDKELENMGKNLIVVIEAPSDTQRAVEQIEIEPNMLFSNFSKKLPWVSNFNSMNRDAIIFTARRESVDFIFMDQNLAVLKNLDAENAKQMDTRGNFMYSKVTENIGANDVFLFYCGSQHASKSPSYEGKDGGVWYPLANRFCKKYGSDQVVSIRNANWMIGIDGLTRYQSVRLGNCLPSAYFVAGFCGNGINSIVVPEGGLVKSKEGLYDYVSVDPELPNPQYEKILIGSGI